MPCSRWTDSVTQVTTCKRRPGGSTPGRFQRQFQHLSALLAGTNRRTADEHNGGIMNAHALTVIHTSTPDTAYLADALRRAGRPTPAPGTLLTRPLDGGRTGARVCQLQCDDGARFVLKIIPRKRAFHDALGHDGEAAAWQAGTTDRLPLPLSNPALDAGYHSAQGTWWLLMDDVSHGIVGRADWREQHTQQLFHAVASLHAAHWGCDAAELPQTANIRASTGLLVEIALYALTGRAATPWVAQAAKDFAVPQSLLPDFLEVAGPVNADFYLSLLQQWPALADKLDACTPTLIHGDLRRANIAFVDDQVSLFDWEFAARGPAAADLTWHWFLQYWAYPPPDGRTPDDRLWLRDAYLQQLEAALGDAIDQDDFLAAWDLGWLRVFCQLGFVLADGLAGEQLAVKQRVIHTAFNRARRIADAYIR